MLMSLSDLFLRVDQDEEEVGHRLIEDWGVGLGTLDGSSAQRTFLDVALKRPTRVLFDAAVEHESRYRAMSARDSTSWTLEDARRWACVRRQEVWTSLRESSWRDVHALEAACEGGQAWAVKEALKGADRLQKDGAFNGFSEESVLRALAKWRVKADPGVHDDQATIDALRWLQPRYQWTRDIWNSPTQDEDFHGPLSTILLNRSSGAGVIAWFVDEIQMPLEGTFSTRGWSEIGWDVYLRDQPSLEGIAWLIERGYPLDRPAVGDQGYDDALSLRAWLTKIAATPASSQADAAGALLRRLEQRALSQVVDQQNLPSRDRPGARL